MDVSTRSSCGDPEQEEPDESDAPSVTYFSHIVVSVVLWGSALGLGLLFKDVSIILELSGIYILMDNDFRSSYQ